MDLDPRKLSVGELCQILNSHALIGEVTTEAQIRKHQKRAGMRIGDGKTIDLPRYIAWLVHTRHTVGVGHDEKKEPPKALAIPAEAQLAQVIKWILEGKSETDVSASIANNFKGADASALLRSAAHTLKRAGKFDPDVVRGFVFEGLRDTYRRAVESNDNASAIRALKILLEMANVPQDGENERLQAEIDRLKGEIDSAEQLLFNETTLPASIPLRA